MIRRLQLLIVLSILLATFEFVWTVSKEGELVKKTLSIGITGKSSVCSVQTACNFDFSTRVTSPTPTLGISERQILENVKVEATNAPVKNDYCLNVPVLTYHRIQPWAMAIEKGQTAGSVDNLIFDQQMSYLASNGYNTVFAEDLINALKTHTELPSKSVLVTLDDGYENAYIYAYPTAHKYQIKLNLMISTGLVGNTEYLSWNQIKEMKDSGLVYLTNHTWSHYPIGQGSIDKIRYEIETAKQQLEQYTGQTVNIFTYPYGSFNPNAIEILKQNGFIGGFSTIPGRLQCESYIMTLHRTGIGNSSLSSYGL